VDTPETVTAAVQLLEARGFSGSFRVADAGVHCVACAVDHRPSALAVRATFRFEGTSDPGDEAIVLGVECPACGVRGIVVSAFGPDADPELLALLDRLEPES
jgi:hypothetical protein